MEYADGDVGTITASSLIHIVSTLCVCVCVCSCSYVHVRVCVSVGQRSLLSGRTSAGTWLLSLLKGSGEGETLFLSLFNFFELVSSLIGCVWSMLMVMWALLPLVA